ncbi:MAG: shikimate dehydrogenase [Akkermansiaceae bacterium]
MKEVYHLADLDSREKLDAGADKPAKLAVIGHPVAHSASPQMHQAALDAQDIDVRYIRIDLEPESVGEAFARMQELGFIGCNVTVPHKLEAMDNCAVLSPDAKALQAVNTVIFGDEVMGHNTDAGGFVKAIREEFGIDLGDLRVMIVGAGGGAGRAVTTQCARSGCERIWMVNRTLEKTLSLRDELKTLIKHGEKLEGPGDRLECMTPDDPGLAEAAGHVDLIINATSLGLKQFDPLPLPEECIQPHHLVYDMIYNPALTPLLKHARSAGARTGNGLSMLLHQGVLSYECWFPDPGSPLEHMRHGLAS